MSKPTLQELLKKRKENLTPAEKKISDQISKPAKKTKRPPIRIVRPIKYAGNEDNKVMIQAIAELAHEMKKLQEDINKISSKTNSIQKTQDEFFKEIKKTIKTYHSSLMSELDEIEKLEKKIYEKKEEISSLEKETVEKEKKVNKKREAWP